MKKSLLAAALVIILASPLTAVDYGEGRMKLGGVVGYPVLAAVFGYPVTDNMEFNALFGFDYRNFYTKKVTTSTTVPVVISGGTASFRTLESTVEVEDVTGALYLGANLLFNLVDIGIEGESFPLSLGPHVGVSINFEGNVRIDALANLRWEYTFNIPLNLFVDVGLGMGINTKNKNRTVQFSGLFLTGIRYVF